jgi:thioredoxin 1
MNQPIHINDAEFEDKVMKSTTPVVVDFWATWCAPCKMIAPILDKIASEYAGKLTVVKVDTDQNPEWAIKFGVQGIPTVLFMDRGQLRDRMVGAGPAAMIKAKVEALMKAAEQIT